MKPGADTQPVALITGASRGIGRGIAQTLAGEGYAVAGTARRYDPAAQETGLAQVAARISASGGRFLPLAADVADLTTHATVIEEVVAHFGRIDLFVCNAGVAPLERTDVLQMTPESYDRVMGINARGAFFLTQRVARQILSQPVGSHPAVIVFVSSISAVVSSPLRAEYCLSKAALSQAAQVYADRLAADGILVYDLRPGLITTDMTAEVAGQYEARIADGLVPLERWGSPEEIGRTVAALARGDLGYATGLVLELSGGMNIRRL